MVRRSISCDVAVIGGGVSGLAAARDLGRSGFKVVLLEARRRLGGRIDTRRVSGWPGPVELGAEFIHSGNAELWRLVRESGARTRKLRERHWTASVNGFERVRNIAEEIASVTRKISPSRADGLSFEAYFRKHPAKVDARAWRLAREFVQGFEAAPLGRISAKSLAGESLDDGGQFILPGGYEGIVAQLAGDCRSAGVELVTGAVVRTVGWGRRRVRIATRAGKAVEARAAVVTLPLGVLKARGGRGAVRFDPVLNGKQPWIDRMEMGNVARMVFRFSRSGWRRLFPSLAARPGGFGFIHADAQPVPVWWSHSAEPILVGWAGGPHALALLGKSPRAMRWLAVRSLASVFQVPAAAVAREVAGFLRWDWTHDAFSRGAYSYTAAGQDRGASILGRPVRGTLFFAGEATAEGSETGTVHGAMKSGLRTARQAAASLRRR
jgi:monoamine oxidase